MLKTSRGRDKKKAWPNLFIQHCKRQAILYRKDRPSESSSPPHRISATQQTIKASKLVLAFVVTPPHQCNASYHTNGSCFCVWRVVLTPRVAARSAQLWCSCIVGMPAHHIEEQLVLKFGHVRLFCRRPRFLSAGFEISSELQQFLLQPVTVLLGVRKLPRVWDICCRCIHCEWEYNA